MLHIVNKSPFERNSLESCLRICREGSAIILIEDGVYAARRGTSVARDIQRALQQHPVYVLQADIEARGISAGEVLDGVVLVDYRGFVRLVTENDKVQTWL